MFFSTKENTKIMVADRRETNFQDFWVKESKTMSKIIHTMGTIWSRPASDSVSKLLRTIGCKPYTG